MKDVELVGEAMHSDTGKTQAIAVLQGIFKNLIHALAPRTRSTHSLLALTPRTRSILFISGEAFCESSEFEFEGEQLTLCKDFIENFMPIAMDTLFSDWNLYSYDACNLYFFDICNLKAINPLFNKNTK
jgi:hypothetical protein